MTKDKMQEAEVSLLIALAYIKNKKTNEDVSVSVDGAHVKTGDTIHFDIKKFYDDHGLVKEGDEIDRWQGTYKISDELPRIIVHSRPGSGDVNIVTLDGQTLYIESKKGDLSKNRGQEYPLMREAIGQLMTGIEINDNMIPIVAVPYSDKSLALSTKWIKFPQIKLLGIRFMLVKENGDIIEIEH